MDIQSIKSLVDVGLGPLAFIALIVAGAKVWKFMDLMVNNHLTHIQSSLEDAGGHIKDMSKTMVDLTDAIKELAKK